MWNKAPSAWLQQKKVALNDDDITNEESEFLSGLIEFQYFAFKRKHDVAQSRLDKDEITYLLRTRSAVDFQAGDRVKVGGRWHTILSVRTTIEERHNAFLSQNPYATERLSVKELELK